MARSMKTILLVGLLLAVVGLAGWYGWSYWGPQDPEEGTGELVVAEKRPDVQLTGTRLIGRHEGKRQWEISSDSMVHDGDIVHFDRIQEVVIMQDEQPHYYVEADTGEWHRKSDDLHLYGSIVVTGPDDFRLETTRLIWRAQTEQLEGPDPVKMDYQGAVITADKMTSNVNTNEVDLQGNVGIRDGNQVWRLEHVIYSFDTEVMEIRGGALLELENVARNKEGDNDEE